MFKAWHIPNDKKKQQLITEHFLEKSFTYSDMLDH